MRIYKLTHENATEQNLQQMAELHQSNFIHGWSADSILKMLKATQYFGFAIELDEQIIAYAIMLDQKIECEIMTIIVDQTYRKNGLGQKLLNYILDDIKARKYLQILLEVNVINKSAISLYQKNGFKEVGLRKDYYTDLNGIKQDGLIFSLEL